MFLKYVLYSVKGLALKFWEGTRTITIVYNILGDLGLKGQTTVRH